MDLFRYQAYGLEIESELPLPELPRSEGTSPAEVRLRLGPVPEHLDAPAGTGVLFEAGPNEFLLKMPNIANYLVRNGDEIVIDDLQTVTPQEVRVFLLGSGLGALLHQRGHLVLHAAAMHTEHGAVLFAGPSGIGKSTLLGEMLARGYPMIVDDVCAVTTSPDNQPIVLPGYPRTRLWSDAAQKLAIDTRHLERTRPTIEKFERQVPDSFWSEPAPFARLYLLADKNCEEPTIKRLSAVEAFAAVLQNTYRGRFMDGLAMRDKHFKLASSVGSGAVISRVTRSSATFMLAELADRIEEDLTTP